MPIESSNEKKSIPSGLWVKCPGCEEIIYIRELEENAKVCPRCQNYFRLSRKERLDQLIEPDSFQEYDRDIKPVDVLGFIDEKPYSKRLTDYRRRKGINDAVVTGEGMLGPHRIVIGILDFDFMGGSMGAVVGEKITRAIERATEQCLPLIIVSASGGARMQEGIISLMQMAKTSAALARLSGARIPYISVLTHPTSGGVTASFAMLGDINIAEPKALIAFAGPRVIEQTIRQKLPPAFQLSEFNLQHGMIDLIVERKDLKNTLVKILDILTFYLNSRQKDSGERKKKT